MASVNLILLEDVENLGLAGDNISVSPGYARNYLLPRGKATKATPGALRQVAARKQKIEARRKQDKEAAELIAAKIAETEISIPMQAADDEQLFGSVTERVIADAFAAQGIEFDHHKIQLPAHIKQLGMYEVEVQLHPEVEAKAKVWVVRAA